MTKRATELIGKPVVSAGNGKRLGTVGDVLLEDHGTEVVGLVVRHGFMKREEVLPAEAVRSVGPDAVVSEASELVGAREWRDQHETRGRRGRHHHRDDSSEGWNS